MQFSSGRVVQTEAIDESSVVGEPIQEPSSVVDSVPSQAQPCTSRLPVVGDKVQLIALESKIAGKWVLQPGEVATVTSVEPDGDFYLRNPAGTITGIFVRKNFEYVQAELAAKLKAEDEAAAQIKAEEEAARQLARKKLEDEEAAAKGNYAELSSSTALVPLSAFDEFKQEVTTRIEIFQQTKADGYDNKQALADVLAGEYEREAIRAKVDEFISSAPAVMFTWESSPSCKQAVKAFDVAGAKVKIVRLDDPWDEGNPMRAELGKMVGRSSVPVVFIGGKYVGGYDGGVSDEAPGILDLAFKGTLRPKLEAAGAL
jgi:glutaredoxin 3